MSEDSIAIRDAAIAAGWQVIRLQGWRTEPVADVGAIYGETLWARVIASQVGKVLLEPPLDWLTRLDEKAVRRRVRFGTLDSLWPIDLPAFVKPADDKRFPAKVYHTLDWAGIEGPILVSGVLDIEAEYRVWMLNGEPVTSSFYRGIPSRDPTHADRSAELSAHLACKYSGEWMPPAVVDIAWAKFDDGWHYVVIEANPCFGSGIYNADPAQVLEVLAAACVDTAPDGYSQPATIG